jgi:uncharacterized membrane protein YeiH
VLLNDIGSPLKDPKYLFVCVLMGLLELAIYRYAVSKEEGFHTRLRAYFKSFTLPSFTVLGSHNALDHSLGIFAANLVGLISTTAGDVLIDLFAGATSVIVRADEQHATTAVLASTIYSLIAVLVAFLFRVFAVRDHWASLVPLAAPAEDPDVRP